MPHHTKCVPGMLRRRPINLYHRKLDGELEYCLYKPLSLCFQPSSQQHQSSNQHISEQVNSNFLIQNASYLLVDNPSWRRSFRVGSYT